MRRGGACGAGRGVPPAAVRADARARDAALTTGFLTLDSVVFEPGTSLGSERATAVVRVFAPIAAALPPRGKFGCALGLLEALSTLGECPVDAHRRRREVMVSVARRRAKIQYHTGLSHTRGLGGYVCFCATYRCAGER